MNLIENLVEPHRLNLVWQGPDGANRTRRGVGELVRVGTDVRFRYLENSPDYQAALETGFDGYPAFKLKKQEHTGDVLPILMLRLPPRSRRDFGDYLERLRLSPNADISDFALLGYSEAKLPGDGFSIINDFVEFIPPFEFVTEIAGFRYYSGMEMTIRETIGQAVRLEHEPSNKHDPNAIRVLIRGQQIGYINRVQAPTLLRWLADGSIEATIDGINGTGSRPLVYLFVSIRSDNTGNRGTA